MQQVEAPVPQPAKAVLAMYRLPNRTVAAQLGISAHWLGRCLNGWEQPSERIRHELAELLRLPENVLFREQP